MGKVKKPILTADNKEVIDGIKQQFDALKLAVTELEPDLAKFCEKGNKVAGTRIRSKLQDIKKLSQVIRECVQSIKKSE